VVPSSEPAMASPAPVSDTVAEPVATPAPVPRAARTRTPATETVSRPAPAPPVAADVPVTDEPAPVAAPLASAEPAPVLAEPAEPSATSGLRPDEGAMIAAGALALLGLAGAALVGRRRKRIHSAAPATATLSEPPRAKTIRPGAFITTGPVEPQRSAFAWGAASAAPAPAPADGDRIAAAYRGPTPDNPSLSLKKRLKRATFFEQRERAVRAGRAKPVSPLAGLPSRLVEEVRQARTASPRSKPALQPA
jgi:MYXO-CTERM domain-containing protein